MKGENEAMEIFELVKRNNMLPSDPTKLEKIQFIGPAALSYYRAKIKLMTLMGAVEEQREATLSDGQDAGEMLLDVEVKLGELYQEVEKEKPFPGSRTTSDPSEVVTRAQKIGKSAQRISETEQVAKNPQVVAAIKAEARERNDIPTKTAVLASIRNHKLTNELKEAREEKKRERILNKKKPPSIDKYINELEIMLDDGREKLAALVGQTENITSNTNRETFKISLVAFINVAEKIRKEL